MISVIIPLYNKETSIFNTINSVLNQTYPNFELLIVDDGSTDSSIEMVNTINDGRIRVMSKQNEGVSSARNFGIENSKGEYVFFLDADDIIKENCFEELINISTKYKEAQVITCNFKMITEKRIYNFCNGTEEGYIESPFKHFWKRNVFLRTGNVLIKKSCFIEMDIWFNPKISLYEDLDFMVRILSRFKVAYTPKSLFVYDTSHSSLSLSKTSIEKEFAYYIKLDNNFNYKNIILSENVLYSHVSKLRRKDYRSFFRLLKKNINRIHIIIYTYIYRKSIK